MGKKKQQRNILGEAVAEALNAAFEFGMAHQVAMDAAGDAAAAQQEAIRTGHELSALLFPHSKSELN